MKFDLFKSESPGKKWKAVFTDEKTGKHKTIHFGATGYQDFTQHHDEDRKASYLARHKTTESWDNPMTAGSLSRWVLWNKPTIAGSVTDFKRRFGLS
jgi:hypothetical protein